MSDLFGMPRRQARRLGLMLSLSFTFISGLGFSPPARASLDSTLAPLPDDALAVITVHLNPTHWQYLLGKVLKKTAKPAAEPAQAKAQPRTQEAQQARLSITEAPLEQLQELMKVLKSEFAFDPVWDGLLNLGSHLSLAYRPWPGTSGQILFSLDLKSTDRVSGLLERLHDRVTRSGDFHSLVVEDFGPCRLYHLQRQGEAPFGFDQLHLAVSGHNLVGTVGEGSDLLKRMLYLQTVLGPDSRFHLSQQPLFAPIRQALEHEPLWFYLDAQGGLKALSQGAGDSQSRELGLVSQLLTLQRGLGLSARVESDGFKFKSFVVPDKTALTPAQLQFLQALEKPSEHPLSGLLDRLPPSPLLFAGGQGLDVALSQPWPVDVAAADLPLNPAEIRQQIQAIFNLDYTRDFVPRLDGRYGLGVIAPENEKAMPQVVLYLGVRNGQEAAFDRLMQQQLQINLTALQALGNASENRSDIQENMLTLKTMVETYNVDHEAYPADLARLRAAASGTDQDYWQDIVNPLTGKSGLREAAELQRLPDASLAGNVFYRFLPAQAGQAASYEIFGYDPGGELYRLSGDTTDFERVRQDLPRREQTRQPDKLIHPHQLGEHQGIPYFAFDLDLGDTLPAGLSGQLQPVYARKGDVWMLASSPATLKAALAGQAPARLRYWIDKTQQQQAAGLFFLDLVAGAGLFKELLPQMTDQPDEAQAVKAMLAPWHALFSGATRTKSGTRGDVVVDVDVDHIDFSRFLQLFSRQSAPVSAGPEQQPAAIEAP